MNIEDPRICGLILPLATRKIKITNNIVWNSASLDLASESHEFVELLVIYLIQEHLFQSTNKA